MVSDRKCDVIMEEDTPESDREEDTGLYNTDRDGRKTNCSSPKRKRSKSSCKSGAAKSLNVAKKTHFDTSCALKCSGCDQDDELSRRKDTDRSDFNYVVYNPYRDELRVVFPCSPNLPYDRPQEESFHVPGRIRQIEPHFSDTTCVNEGDPDFSCSSSQQITMPRDQRREEIPSQLPKLFNEEQCQTRDTYEPQYSHCSERACSLRTCHHNQPYKDSACIPDESYGWDYENRDSDYPYQTEMDWETHQQGPSDDMGHSQTFICRCNAVAPSHSRPVDCSQRLNPVNCLNGPDTSPYDQFCDFQIEQMPQDCNDLQNHPHSFPSRFDADLSTHGCQTSMNMSSTQASKACQTRSFLRAASAREKAGHYCDGASVSHLNQQVQNYSCDQNTQTSNCGTPQHPPMLRSSQTRTCRSSQPHPSVTSCQTSSLRYPQSPTPRSPQPPSPIPSQTRTCRSSQPPLSIRSCQTSSAPRSNQPPTPRCPPPQIPRCSQPPTPKPSIQSCAPRPPPPPPECPEHQATFISPVQSPPSRSPIPPPLPSCPQPSQMPDPCQQLQPAVVLGNPQQANAGYGCRCTFQTPTLPNPCPSCQPLTPNCPSVPPCQNQPVPTLYPCNQPISAATSMSQLNQGCLESIMVRGAPPGQIKNIGQPNRDAVAARIKRKIRRDRTNKYHVELEVLLDKENEQTVQRALVPCKEKEKVRRADIPRPFCQKQASWPSSRAKKSSKSTLFYTC